MKMFNFMNILYNFLNKRLKNKHEKSIFFLGQDIHLGYFLDTWYYRDTKNVDIFI